MKKYYLVYYVDDDVARGCNSTYIKLAFDITKSNIRRVELKLKNALDVKRVVIISYRKVEG